MATHSSRTILFSRNAVNIALPAQLFSHRQLNSTGKTTGSSKLISAHVVRSRFDRTHKLCVASSSAGDLAKLFHKDCVLPDQLLPCDPSTVDVKNHSATVYTVRLLTGVSRRAGLSAPLAGVQLCLIGGDGRAVLYRVAPENNHEQAGEDVARICAVVDESVGINCTLTSASASFHLSSTSNHHKPRFQEGAVDEVSFLAPDLGPLAGLMVAPEAGSWMLDEVNVVSSRTGHTDRFVNCKPLGDKVYDSAAYLTPVPVGAVVYGSGNDAIILTKEQAATLKAAGLSEYQSSKQRLLAVSAALTAGGTCVAAATAGTDAAIPFVLGGAAGVAYSLFLQNRVDSLQLTGEEKGAASLPFGILPSNPTIIAAMVRGNSYRTALCAAAGLLALWSMADGSGNASGEVDSWPVFQGPQAWQLLSGALGFFTYKLAFLTVELTAKDKAPQQALQALDNRK